MDDEIIQQRISGRSVHAIAKAQGRSVAEVNRVIDRWCDQTLTDKARKHSLVLTDGRKKDDEIKH